ncbi:co-chaperone DjlA [Legionella israelensis]|uniref:co-chaperone DjlA n=1 Tax=Legionella israelensis TaxID=454 RepID=UPI00117EE1F3|nr:co-chaperone DjlA [Legionella israelensis]QDP73200.1 co-chaperone DjlA [Legionella israelensis]
MKNLREFFITHSWWGKLLGAFFGYLITGGPAGALFGLLVGNLFDRGLVAHFSRPHWEFYSEKREAVQKVFFEATFTIMGHIAKADGRVSEKEIEMATLLMKEMRLSSEQKAQARRFFREGKSKNFDLTSMLSLLHNTCRLNPDLLKLFVDIQYRAAKIDGLSKNKINVLDTVFRRLGLAPLHQQYRFYQDFGYQDFETSHQQRSQQQESYSDYSQRSYQSTSSMIDQAYALLEVSSNASKQEVKRAYRRLISRNHPDKLIAQGLPESMIKMANEKTQKIRKAYEYICNSKGWHH